MEQAILQLIKELPVAGAMILMTILHLRQQTKRDDMIERIETRCSDALKETAKSMTEFAGVLGELRSTIENLSSKP